MAFRRNESEEEGFEKAIMYLTHKDFSPVEKKEIEYYIDDLRVKLGPIVDRYPRWHPLVSNHDLRIPETRPHEYCGYKGLDHNIYFVNGFISCPYNSCDEIITSVEQQQHSEANSRYSHVATLRAERIEKKLYNEGTDPVLVVCDWQRPIPIDKTIPKNIAIGLMLEQEIPGWRDSQLGETWETMSTYLMGEPCGKRSSMFLDQETGQAMKKVYEAIVYSGMFGPLRV